MNIRLYRSSDDFVIKTSSSHSAKYQLSVEDLCLYVRHVRPSSTIMLQHAKILAKQTAIYPIDRSFVKTVHITKGLQEETVANLFMGQLPVRLIIGLVKTTDYTGNRATTPFSFNHFGINHISLGVNGRQIPARAFEPNFSENRCRREYYHLLETVLGACQDERSIGLSLEDYISGGKTLFGFNLAPDGGGTASVLPRRFGNINLRLRFQLPLEQNLTVLVFAEFQNQIEIDAARQIHTDFG